MNREFPFYFDDGQVMMEGSFSLNKIKKQYHPNYDYFKVRFCKGNLYIKDKFKEKFCEYDLKGIESVITLKKEYLKENSLKNKDSKVFMSVGNKNIENKYDLYVVNVDINNKLDNNYILRGLLNEKLKYIFLGNENNLLKIQN